MQGDYSEFVKKDLSRKTPRTMSEAFGTQDTFLIDKDSFRRKFGNTRLLSLLAVMNIFLGILFYIKI